jgi:hypothetical protein
VDSNDSEYRGDVNCDAAWDSAWESAWDSDATLAGSLTSICVTCERDRIASLGISEARDLFRTISLATSDARDLSKTFSSGISDTRDRDMTLSVGTSDPRDRDAMFSLGTSEARERMLSPKPSERVRPKDWSTSTSDWTRAGLSTCTL